MDNKEEIKNQLAELISSLDYALAAYTYDSNSLINIDDGYDLIRHCSKANNYGQQICDLAEYGEADDYFQDERKELDEVIDYYEDQIKNFKEACQEASKE